MPIREYQVKQGFSGCSLCNKPFERIERVGEEPLQNCPSCGCAVERIVSLPRVGASKSNFDDNAKSAGFHKLKKVSKGEYEKIY